MIDHVVSLISSYSNTHTRMLEEASSLSHEEYASLSKELSDMEDAYRLAVSYQKLHDNIVEAKEILSEGGDEDDIMLAKEQLNDSQKEIEKVEEALKIALLPKDPRDDKNVFIEMRPAAGGDEASLFAQELMRSYMMYAQSRGWKPDVVEYQGSDVGGLKFAVIKISGKKVFSRMKFESGVHRVQRIPNTESNGRVHTSTITVAIMPEAADVDVQLDMKDVKMDTFAASSAGGQNANKNQTGVRLRHEPTGIIVTIADSKSQMQNKEKAFAILKAKLYQNEVDEQMAKEKNLRGSQIGRGDRSEKIRTYNFPQDRVTDHRVKQSWSNLPAIMSGDIDDLIETLIVDEQVALLAEAAL